MKPHGLLEIGNRFVQRLALRDGSDLQKIRDPEPPAAECAGCDGVFKVLRGRFSRFCSIAASPHDTQSSVCARHSKGRTAMREMVRVREEEDQSTQRTIFLVLRKYDDLSYAIDPHHEDVYLQKRGGTTARFLNFSLELRH